MTFLWHIVALIGVTLPNVLGYNLVFGKGKVFHFGPVGVSLFSSYATFVTLRATESYPLAVLAGFAAALCLSGLFAWLAQRLEPDGLGVMSIAVHLAVLSVVLNWTGVTRGALGIPGIPRLSFLRDLPSFAVGSILIAGLWAAALHWIQRGPFGRRLGALAEQEWHAEALGVSKGRTRTAAFLLAAVGATITGALFPQYIQLLHPSDYNFPSFIFIVMIVVAGGPGSVPGVILSCVALILLREALRFLPLPTGMIGAVRLMLFGAILFAAVWLRRDKLFPAQRSV